MANSKGNQYPFWYISNEFQVFAVDSNQTPHQMSNTNFASDIGISEDGTVWVLSIKPDPDGGGGRIYWSNGDNNWNEIATSDPGGMRITGAASSNCMYITGAGDVYTLNTNGKASKSFSTNEGILNITYGGDYIWAILPEKTGGIPVLRFMKVPGKNNWTTFAGNAMPMSISASYSGDCFGVDGALNPVYFSKDGSSSGSSGSGADGIGLQTSFKNWNYLLTTDANSDGNLVYEWVDTNGGTFQPTSIRAAKIAATYYSKS